ncbi:AraC family transcriptional regulator [Aquimarina algiphila]|uniref:AraC family transcriptional regulator n=1 Tax=Aquimarina algiphila TaxID=2047982 RepID=UPI00232FEC95|nr:AraC family transcriptional regulator [Aquimarina algiphila]
MQLRFYTITLLLLLSFVGFGQSFKVPDSLLKLEYKELYYRFHKNRKIDDETAKIYALAYFYKSKDNNDNIRIAKAYILMSQLYPYTDEKRIKTLDSAFIYVENSTAKNYPEALYTIRGIAFGNRGDFQNALKDYLKALEYSKKVNNYNYTYALKHNIALIKRKLGKYQEAKKLFNECLIYEKSKVKKTEADTLSYLITLSEQISVYRLNNELDSAKILNDKGIELSKQKTIGYLFKLNNGIFNYYNKEYQLAVEEINTALPKFFIKENKFYYENYNLISAYLYLGRSYKHLNKKEKAIIYFKKIDSISKSINYFTLESRSAYIELVNYYKSTGDYSNQLLFIDKLLSADSVLTRNYRLISDQLYREFDTKELIKEKEQIITALEKENTKISTQNIIISILLIISLFGGGYYYYRQHLYKKRFLKLLDKTNTTNQKKDRSDNDDLSSSSSINKETLNHLMDKLQVFEEKQGYLKQGLNTKDLAKSFGSNASYLSKVVNTFKEKNFTSYINDLRIDFVVTKLREDRIFRKYTVKAIAQDIGFNNAEAFAKAFYKKTGIYPSYFIKELEKR